MTEKLRKKRKPWRCNDFQLFFLAMTGVLFLVVFCYVPMFGIVLAFKNGDGVLNIADAITKSEWVGFANFRAFFKDPNFKSVLVNTVCLNLLQLVINFPAPIIFALLLNECPHKGYKKAVQSISYMPYFLSWAVFAGNSYVFLRSEHGYIQ